MMQIKFIRNIILITLSVAGMVRPAFAQQENAGKLVVDNDLVYKQHSGTTTPLALDAYHLDDARHTKRPAILFVHGGGFWEGDKHSDLYVKMATAFALHGYISFSVNYTLKAKVTPYNAGVLDTCKADVMAAVQNPLIAAKSSTMLQQNKENAVVWNGKADEPFPIWETEASVRLSLVSPYWKNYADKLISLVKEYGVTYFKWDGISQYAANGSGHYYGTPENSQQERQESYAFQLPVYMSKIIDRVVKACPASIFDFDITEDGRCVGLQFLSSGKFFAINNGPYFHNFDLAEEWKSPLANGNANIFVNPGPSRGWFTRSVLGYDKWIPSILFLTHYQADEPRNSQLINVASLILGQNGIWGDIRKTSPEGIVFLHDVLDKYKQVRNDITASNPVVTGETGLSPEIHEKINSENGKGAVVVFANLPGHYRYITQNKVVAAHWHNDGVKVQFDKTGRAIIDMDFTESSAKIIFFGAQ